MTNRKSEEKKRIILAIEIALISVSVCYGLCWLIVYLLTL